MDGMRTHQEQPHILSILFIMSQREEDTLS